MKIVPSQMRILIADDNELTRQTKIEEAESAYALAQLTQVQVTIFVTGPILFVIGPVLLGITIYVSRSYRRKLDETIQTEIARFERMALTDPLTGLGNHYAYQEDLARALEEARGGGEALVLAMLDIDEFKVINDEQGHQRGDEILRSIATLLREANLSDAMKWIVRGSIPIAAILVPAAFFLSVLSPDAKAPNGLIYLAYVGAAVLAVGVFVLGIGLVRRPAQRS